MYTLRTLEKTRIENTFLGKGYSRVMRGSHKEAFEAIMKREGKEGDSYKAVEELICADDNVIPIIKGYTYYIMSPNGQTLERIHYSKK